MRKLVIWSVAALLLTASSAFAKGARTAGEHESSLSISLSHGTGEYGLPVGPGDDYIDVATWGEIGGNAEFGYTFSEDHALAIGFDLRAGSLKQEPTTFAAPGTPDQEFRSTSWRIRVGCDRTGKIGSRFKWYMGPGLEYGSGAPKVETTTTVEGENTGKFGIDGRIGGVMMMNSQFGIRGQIGNSFGRASVEDAGGQTTWWYSNFESAWGIQFALGK